MDSAGFDGCRYGTRLGTITNITECDTTIISLLIPYVGFSGCTVPRHTVRTWIQRKTNQGKALHKSGLSGATRPLVPELSGGPLIHFTICDSIKRVSKVIVSFAHPSFAGCHEAFQLPGPRPRHSRSNSESINDASGTLALAVRPVRQCISMCRVKVGVSSRWRTVKTGHFRA
ncbi:hypothetical protein BJV78DRAFT_405890 [Lactifluus subvellereus]|nr:hypothetical protein BJV78DRAFT_405890 [Lactifluus subvellereus]